MLWAAVEAVQRVGAHTDLNAGGASSTSASGRVSDNRRHPTRMERLAKLRVSDPIAALFD